MLPFNHMRRSTGRPLDAATVSFEPPFGHDFSQVRVDTDSTAEQSTRDVSTNAYTVGGGRASPRFSHHFAHTTVLGKAPVLVRQPKPSKQGARDAGTSQTRTGSGVVKAQRLKTSGTGLTGHPLGMTDQLSYRMNGVEIQFELDPVAARGYKNLRPKQWSGTESMWVRRTPAPESWRLEHVSRGAGDDSPEPDVISASSKVIAFYDSPGIDVGRFLKSPPSRVYLVQNFTSWLVGDPVGGGPPTRLNPVLSWHNVVNLIDDNWPTDPPKWLRVYGNRVGAGWANTNLPPVV